MMMFTLLRMHNIYLLQKLILDHTIMLATSSKVRPSCTIWAIRNYFPSENQEYTPVLESNDNEHRTFQ